MATSTPSPAESIGLVVHAAGATVTATPTTSTDGTTMHVRIPVADTTAGVRAVARSLDAILDLTGTLRVETLPHADGDAVSLTLSTLPVITVTTVGEGEQTVVGGVAGWHGMIGHHRAPSGDGLPPLGVALVPELGTVAGAPTKARVNPLALVTGLRPAPAPAGAAPREDVQEYVGALSRLRDPRAYEAVMHSAKLARTDSEQVSDSRGFDVTARVSVRALPTLQSVHVGPRGLQLTFAAVPTGVGADDWAKGVPVLAAALGVSPAGVVVDHLADGRVRVVTGDRDPFSSVTLPQALADVPTGPDRVYVGAREDGSAAWMQLRDSSSLLISGLSGVGKTDAVLGLVQSITASRPTELVVVSGKASDDMQPIGEGARTYIIGSATEDREQLADALDALIDERTRASRAWASSNYWAVSPADRAPLVIVVLDEVHRLLSGTAASAEGKQAKRLSTLLHELITAGRSLGIWTVLTTQRPSSKVLDTDLRESITTFIALRQTTSTAKMSLPEGYPWQDDVDLDPSRLPVHVQGRAVVTAIPTADGTPLTQVQLLHIPTTPSTTTDNGKAA
ncbi:AAA family ATPase [Tsukamurella pseudospumae]|uniref:FtsK domain-containing protein n=1 Tax=Tsukamurella pseudospumae TaxID=239498 RepID=A0A138AU33_9ACTN|nr:AAA family ATPase [Tsukamurella pseudospumae]KXP13923.1 hypothetical protein AXK60_22735 [Tsukamurella pseudospumae]